MAILDRLFGRERSGTGPDQSFNGTVRVGGSYYNAKWSFTRALNDVYSNPTGFRCVNMIADDFSRPPSAIYTESPNTPVTDTKATELLTVLNRPDRMMSGTAMQRQIALDRELNRRTFWLQLRNTDMWGDKGKLTGLKRLPCENVTVVTKRRLPR